MKIDKETGLRECPFCGVIPSLKADSQCYWVSCENENCACLPTSWSYDTKFEAIAAWNRRYDPEGDDEE